MRILCLVPAMVSLLFCAGCILSVTPSTSDTVYLNPGESQVFSVKARDGSPDHLPGNYAWEWQLIDEATETVLGYNGDDVFSAETITDTDGGSPYTYSIGFTPDQESAGAYKVRYTGYLRYSFGTAYIPVSNEKRTWNVVVQGIQVRPLRTITVAAGQSETYTATAFPEGEYTYEWFLDGVLIGSGQSFEFCPETSQSGSHTLSVTAASDSIVYTFTREIIVPLAAAGGSGHDVATCIKKTADGGYIVGGYSNSSDIPDTLHGYNNDAYVIKFDSLGAVVWQKLYDFHDAGGDDYVTSIEQTQDGGYILLSNNALDLLSGTFLVKLDADGKIEWSDSFTGGFVGAVKQIADGGYIVTNLSNIGYYDWAIAATNLDASGTVTGELILGGSGAERGLSLCLRESGGYLIAGVTNSTDITDAGVSNDVDNGYIASVDGMGTLAWQKLLNLNGEALRLIDMIASAEGGFIAVGGQAAFRSCWPDDSTFPVLGLNDITVVKFDEDGTVAWNNLYSGIEDYSYMPAALFQTSAGDYWIVGRAHNDAFDDYSYDGYLLRLDQNGTVIGQRTIHDESNVESGYDPQTTLIGVAEADDGNYCVLANTGMPDSDIILLKIDANGE